MYTYNFIRTWINKTNCKSSFTIHIFQSWNITKILRLAQHKINKNFWYMEFENHRKSLIQHFEAKINQKCQKLSILASFWKPGACAQTVLPDRSVLKGQKLVENAKIQIIKCYILSNFETMCRMDFRFFFFVAKGKRRKIFTKSCSTKI